MKNTSQNSYESVLSPIERSQKYQYFKSIYPLWDMNYHTEYLSLVRNFEAGNLTDEEMEAQLNMLESDVGHPKKLH